MKRAIEIALASESEGNLPIGSIITLDDEIIAEGNSAVLEPVYNPGRHAEIMAIRDVDTELWPRAAEMTCYTTLEPCVMCAGTLLLHGVGRVVFGAHDTLGGAGCTLKHLPAYYDDGGVYDWVGPLMPEVCAPLYERADAAFEDLPVGRNQWSEAENEDSPLALEDLFEKLDAWRRENPQTLGIRRAREHIAELADRLDDDRRDDVLPYARTLFERSGYLKDFRALKRYARRAGHPDPFEDVEEAVRENLPDIWIRRALERGNRQAAVDCWYEFEDHRRARHCADEMVAACGDEDAELLISCRLSTVNYLIGRRARRHYRKACAELRKLRDELGRAGAAEYWHFVIDDIQTRYDSRPALLDELDKAGFVDS